MNVKAAIRSDNPQNHRPILGFVHIPKTAGSSIKFVLRNSSLWRHCDLQPLERYDTFKEADFRFMRKFFFFGIHSISGHSLNPLKSPDDSVQFFTMVREPLQRCLSHYQHVKRAHQRRGKDITFEKFLQFKPMHNHQVQHIAKCQDLDKALEEISSRYLFVGLSERFAESLLVLERLSPYRLDIRFKHMHVAKDNTAKQEVLDNPVLCRLLEESNRLDLELYSFVRDRLYPEQRAGAGLEPREVDEKELLTTSYPFRYKFNRWYNLWIYRSLNKVRRKLVGSKETAKERPPFT